MSEIYNGHREVKVLFRCDPAKNTECTKEACYANGGECSRTSKPEFSTDGRILWPGFEPRTGTQVGCYSCPLGSDACAGFRRCTPNGECPCDVYDTYTDYIKAEEESD